MRLPLPMFHGSSREIGKKDERIISGRVKLVFFCEQWVRSNGNCNEHCNTVLAGKRPGNKNKNHFPLDELSRHHNGCFIHVRPSESEGAVRNNIAKVSFYFRTLLL